MKKKKDKKWLQKVNKTMEKKGTVGAFTKYCGGKVTNAGIAKGLASPSAKIRKQAQFAKNMRGLKKK